MEDNASINDPEFLLDIMELNEEIDEVEGTSADTIAVEVMVPFQATKLQANDTCAGPKTVRWTGVRN